MFGDVGVSATRRRDWKDRAHSRRTRPRAAAPVFTSSAETISPMYLTMMAAPLEAGEAPSSASCITLSRYSVRAGVGSICGNGRRTASVMVAAPRRVLPNNTAERRCSAACMSRSNARTESWTYSAEGNEAAPNLLVKGGQFFNGRGFIRLQALARVGGRLTRASTGKVIRCVVAHASTTSARGSRASWATRATTPPHNRDRCELRGFPLQRFGRRGQRRLQMDRLVGGDGGTSAATVK